MVGWFFFFFKQKTAYEIMPSLVGSEMCIRDRPGRGRRRGAGGARRGRRRLMATASRHASGPHSSGASLEELRGWRAFVHLARELKLARLAYPYRRRAVFSVVAMVAVTLSSLAVPYLLKVAIDSGIGAKDLTVLTWVIVAFVGVSLVNLGASYLQTYLTSWVGSHIIYDLRRQLFALSLIHI